GEIIMTPLAALVVLSMAAVPAAAEERTATMDRPDTRSPNEHYVSNRKPLAPSPLVKLPIGTIKPRGWLRKQLELQAEGFHGRLDELSKFLKKENNAWLSKKGGGQSGWEELPYWLNGFGDAGYVLGDQ